ncbi:hypothetical protein [Vibrio sp. St2]|uniref:hypothetical protein n=1 Tax=Vibrio sp. St2 TaxID=2853441 RepID=UPI00248EF100|nr:hypothetical protein [Vibrio sp. St2]
MNKLGIGFLIAVLGIGGLYIGSLQDTIRKLRADKAELQSELDTAVLINESLGKTIEQQKQEITQAQTAADEIDSSESDRREIIVKEVIKIEKELVHEECANVLIPGSSERVYYN